MDHSFVSSDLHFRFAKLLRDGAGVKKGDVVHLLTCGGDLHLIIVVIAAWTLGAVPAFGESTLSDEVLVDHVKFEPELSYATKTFIH